MLGVNTGKGNDALNTGAGSSDGFSATAAGTPAPESGLPEQGETPASDGSGYARYQAIGPKEDGLVTELSLIHI